VKNKSFSQLSQRTPLEVRQDEGGLLLVMCFGGLGREWTE